MRSITVKAETGVRVSPADIVDAFTERWRRSRHPSWQKFIRHLAAFIIAIDDYACDDAISERCWRYLEKVRRKALRDGKDWRGRK